MPKIIALVATKQSGKDTIADYMINNFGFNRYAFADPLKRGVKEMFGLSDAQMWGSQEDKETVDPRWGISSRRLLEIIGTDLFQFDIHKYTIGDEFPIGRAIWVHRFKIWYDEELIKNPNLKIVFSDVRFKHEANAIRNIGGEIWKIERPNNPYLGTHLSETELQEIIPDKVILNDSTLEELFNKIKNNFLDNNYSLSLHK